MRFQAPFARLRDGWRLFFASKKSCNICLFPLDKDLSRCYDITVLDKTNSE